MTGDDETGRLRDELHAVYRAHHAFVWRTLLHLGVRSDAVDDGVQMVLLVVHRRLREYDGRASLRNWLYGITRRIASDLRRRGQRHSAHLRVVAGEEQLEARISAGLDERLSAAETVERFLDLLDDDKREVFVLAEVEGMTAPEIAAALDVNVNTVYARWRAARQLFERAVSRHRARQRRELSRCSR
jgi:RNA polymerase sigma-70 factor (ECF subfamily)